MTLHKDIEKECGMRNRAGEINLREREQKRTSRLIICVGIGVRWQNL